MREEIEQILDDDKCWEDIYIHKVREDRQFSHHLAAIELEKYVKEKALGFMKYYWRFKERWRNKLLLEEFPTEEKLFDMYINNIDREDFKPNYVI